jgi:hypothetical protein
MNVLQAIAELRQSGRRPRRVDVDLVAEPIPDPEPLYGGVAWLQIPRRTGIADIDFRPLVGLQVYVTDRDGNETRLRAASKAIVEVEPALLVVFTERHGAITMHRRFAGNPPTQDSYAL